MVRVCHVKLEYLDNSFCCTMFFNQIDSTDIRTGITQYTILHETLHSIFKYILPGATY